MPFNYLKNYMPTVLKSYDSDLKLRTVKTMFHEPFYFRFLFMSLSFRAVKLIQFLVK